MSLFQHGSSSRNDHYGTDEPYALFAEQHLHAVAGMLKFTTFQAMDTEPRTDATASLSADVRQQMQEWHRECELQGGVTQSMPFPMV